MSVRHRPVPVLRRPEAGLRLVHGPFGGGVAQDRGLPLPSTRPISGTGQPGQPHPQRQDARASDAGPTTNPTMQVVHWSSLLRSCSAYESYLREHHDRIDPRGGPLPGSGPEFSEGLAVLRRSMLPVAPEIAESDDEQGY